MLDDLKQKFEEKFGAYGDVRCCFVPGRVNLIGEHTDYNGGNVFLCALTIFFREKDRARCGSCASFLAPSKTVYFPTAPLLLSYW